MVAAARMRAKVLAHTLGLISIILCQGVLAEGGIKTIDPSPPPPIHTLHDYQIATKFVAAMMLTDRFRAAVDEYQAFNGKWPASNADVDVPVFGDPELGVEGIIESISISKGGVITLEFSDLVPEFEGKSVTLTPSLGAGEKVEFVCSAPAIPRIYRRKSCT
ncbi:MAG: pilin [Rhodanobacteraceae bacterium]